jgi:hypothetical protein
MTSTVSGSAVRTELATLLSSHIAHKNAVLRYAPSAITGSPVITMARASSDRPRLTIRGTSAKFIVVIEVYVLQADVESGWTEEQAQDLLDTIEAEITDVVSQHAKNGTNWDSLDYARQSEATMIIMQGKPYWWERIFLTVEVKGESKTA